MPVNINKLIEAVAVILENTNLKGCLKGSLKGGLVTGISSLIGGVLFGPLGLAIGGAVGGTAAAISAKNSFRPLAVIVNEMSPLEKRKLCVKLQDAFRDVGIQDLAVLLPLLFSSDSLQEIAIKEVSNYLSREMGYMIKN